MLWNLLWQKYFKFLEISSEKNNWGKFAFPVNFLLQVCSQKSYIKNSEISNSWKYHQKKTNWKLLKTVYKLPLWIRDFVHSILVLALNTLVDELQSPSALGSTKVFRCFGKAVSRVTHDCDLNYEDCRLGVAGSRMRDRDIARECIDRCRCLSVRELRRFIQIFRVYWVCLTDRTLLAPIAISLLLVLEM